ncbi:MAG: DUF2029 domain-containing protein [Chloroflexi bacterium]|nr:DUF2029 domain-containing protein [Chloroflexota bacterium]
MANTIASEQPKTSPRQHVLARLLYSHSPTARWARRIATVLGIALGLACLRYPIAFLQSQWIYRKDFLQEYTLARAVADRMDPYLPTKVLAARYLGSLPRRVFPHPTPHPPPVGLLLAPLALFDYSTAAAIWLIVELICLWLAVYLVGRTLDGRFSALATSGTAALLLFWHPFWQELALGQLMVPILALLAGAWLALRRGRFLLGGALIGLAILLKPVPWPVLLLFVWGKDWSALFGATAVILMGYLAAGLVIGLDKFARYFTAVLPLVNQIYHAHAWNISVFSIGWRFFDGTGSAVLEGIVAPPAIHSARVAPLVSVALPCLVLLAACFTLRKQRALETSLGVMLCISILVSPISWNHYMVLAVIPAAQVIHWLIRHHFPSKETNLALIVAALLIVDWGQLTIYLAGPGPVVEGGVAVPFGLSLLSLMPAVAVGALACLLASLEPA